MSPAGTTWRGGRSERNVEPRKRHGGPGTLLPSEARALANVVDELVDGTPTARPLLTRTTRRACDALREMATEVERLRALAGEVERLEDENALLRTTSQIPPDLLRVLRDPSVIVSQDGAAFELIASWRNAPCNTASAGLEEAP